MPVDPGKLPHSRIQAAAPRTTCPRSPYEVGPPGAAVLPPVPAVVVASTLRLLVRTGEGGTEKKC